MQIVVTFVLIPLLSDCVCPLEDNSRLPVEIFSISFPALDKKVIYFETCCYQQTVRRNSSNVILKRNIFLFIQFATVLTVLESGEKKKTIYGR